MQEVSSRKRISNGCGRSTKPETRRGTYLYVVFVPVFTRDHVENYCPFLSASYDTLSPLSLSHPTYHIIMSRKLSLFLANCTAWPSWGCISQHKLNYHTAIAAFLFRMCMVLTHGYCCDSFAPTRRVFNKYDRTAPDACITHITPFRTLKSSVLFSTPYIQPFFDLDAHDE